MKTACNHQHACIQLIQKILDGEASPEEEAMFLEKKEQCLPCQEGYALEKALKDQMKAKCRVACPESLVQRIKEKLFLALVLISFLIPLILEYKLK